MTKNNLLISNFDCKIECGRCYVAGVRIVERYNYTPVEGGYRELIIVEVADIERFRARVTRGLDYAREQGLTVQCNNPCVRDDIENGILDERGLLIVDRLQRTIVDGRALQKKGVSTMKNTPEALKEIAKNLIIDLNKYGDCWAWDCSDCPFQLKEPARDSWGCITQCGWLLLATAAMRILVK